MLKMPVDENANAVTRATEGVAKAKLREKARTLQTRRGAGDEGKDPERFTWPKRGDGFGTNNALGSPLQ